MYHVVFTSKAKKLLEKLDPSVRKKILLWIKTNLEGCNNPYKVPQFKELKVTKKDLYAIESEHIV